MALGSSPCAQPALQWEGLLSPARDIVTPITVCGGFLQRVNPLGLEKGRKNGGYRAKKPRIFHPTAVALSVLPLVLPSDLCLDWSLLRLGLLARMDPRTERSQQGTEQLLGQEHSEEGVAHTDLAQVP